MIDQRTGKQKNININENDTRDANIRKQQQTWMIPFLKVLNDKE